MIGSVVACGIPRSGSTLIWQILQALYPEQEILKTHPDIWDPDGSTAVVTIRDPHDVVASLYRVRLSRDHGRQVGTMRDLLQAIDRMLISYACLWSVLDGPSVVLRYEEFWDDHDVIYNALSTTFRTTISPSTRHSLSEQFGVEANRERASKMRDFRDVDEFQIHGDHMGRVEPDYWFSYLPKWATQRVIEACASVAEEWGYADSD